MDLLTHFKINNKKMNFKILNEILFFSLSITLNYPIIFSYNLFIFNLNFNLIYLVLRQHYLVPMLTITNLYYYYQLSKKTYLN